MSRDHLARWPAGGVVGIDEVSGLAPAWNRPVCGHITRPGMSAPGLRAVRRSLRRTANAQDAANLQRFFKTGPGDYGEGDRFLGVRVPAIRAVLRQTDALTLSEVRTLLHSLWHEERLLALLTLVRRFERGDDRIREAIFHLYLRESRFINNWDLVDLSAPHIVGGWLVDHPREGLWNLARSRDLWERRIAVLATFAFIRRNEFADSLALCRELKGDAHDLMHKACGWTLREVGKRNVRVLESFLDDHAATLPRTMLRYAIERLPEPRRRHYLGAGKTSPSRPPQCQTVRRS